MSSHHVRPRPRPGWPDGGRHPSTGRHSRATKNVSNFHWLWKQLAGLRFLTVVIDVGHVRRSSFWHSVKLVGCRRVSRLPHLAGEEGEGMRDEQTPTLPLIVVRVTVPAMSVEELIVR